MAQTRNSIRLVAASVMVTCGVLAVGNIVFGDRQKKDNPETECFVRPIQDAESIRSVLTDAGIEWFEWEFRAPADSLVEFTFLAIQNGDQVIEPLSNVCEITGWQGKPTTGKVRFIKNDPAAFIKDYQGEVRWSTRISSDAGCTNHAWTPDYQRKLKVSSVTRMNLMSVDKPKIDEEYVIWEFKGYSADAARERPSLQYQIKFKCTKTDKEGDKSPTAWCRSYGPK
jgi:hypothetical protein